MSGMTARGVVRRLQAFAEGRPLPHGSTLHFPVLENDSLLIAFVRMGGETAPWGVGCTKLGQRPTILTVPEPRNRTLVGDMMLDLAEVLLEHLLHPGRSAGEFNPDNLPPLRQIWLPGPTHIEMLHFLAFSYARTRFGGRERRTRLRALGRASGWLFRESERPGQVTVMDAAAALRESYTFPADDLRQQHLGFLLAWLNTSGARDARLRAAAEAETESVATTLDPELERSSLEPLVERWNKAGRGSEKVGTSMHGQIRRILEREIRRRLDLTEQAIRVLQADSRKPSLGIQALEKAGRGEHWYQYLRFELNLDDETDGPAFVPSPETDYRADVAASRFFIREASASLYRDALLHDDTEVQEEAIAAGDAFRGRVQTARDRGNGRKLVPVWTIKSNSKGPLRLRKGSAVVLLGHPKIQGIVVEIEDRGMRGRIVTIEITGGKTATSVGERALLDTADSDLRGAEIIFGSFNCAFLSRKRSSLVWRSHGPGRWLTHPRSGAPDPEEEA